jgi:tetratricopeptide (TPR) repeat protein
MRLFDLFLQRGLIDKATAEADFLAEFYLKERIFDRAADLYMKIREKTPDNIDLRRRLIDIYEKQGDREKILDEKSAVAEIVERSGDLEKAAAIFTEIREGWPEDKACRIRLINLHIQRNLVDEALEETGALYKLLVKEEKYDEAISLYRIILNISPDNMEARQRLLQLYHLTGDEDKVVEELMYLAGYFARTDELEKSHMILDRILAEKHDHFEARVALIGLYLKQNEMAKAEEEVRTLAGIFLDGKGYKDAIEIRNRLVNLAADNLEWRDMLFQYLLLGRESE